MSVFDYDFFHHGGLQRLIDEARRRCAIRKADEGSPEYQTVFDRLDWRVILYIKDGLTYELKELVDIGTKSVLTFECVPVDENYKVGSIVIMAPFEDIGRVEVFAVSPEEKPAESIRIPGFHAAVDATRMEP